MKFTTDAATRRDMTTPVVCVSATDDGDPLQLKGVRVHLTRSDTEPVGTVLGTTTAYGPSREARAFVKLDTGCTAWFPLDDLEPADEVPEAKPSPDLPGFVDFWG